MQLTNSQLRKLSTVSTYSRNLIAYAKDCTSANSPDEEVQMTTLYEEILPALAGRFKMRLTKRLRQYLTNTGALPFPFDGEPELLGGLTNEKEVADAAPDDFEYLAQWRRAANDIFAKGANTTEWKHLSEDPVVREMQEDVLFGLLGTFGLGHRQKEKAAAWMLSQMLEEPPRELQAGDKINKPALFFPM